MNDPVVGETASKFAALADRSMPQQGLYDRGVGEIARIGNLHLKL